MSRSYTLCGLILEPSLLGLLQHHVQLCYVTCQTVFVHTYQRGLEPSGRGVNTRRKVVGGWSSCAERKPFCHAHWHSTWGLSIGLSTFTPVMALRETSALCNTFLQSLSCAVVVLCFAAHAPPQDLSNNQLSGPLDSSTTAPPPAAPAPSTGGRRMLLQAQPQEPPATTNQSQPQADARPPQVPSSQVRMAALALEAVSALCRSCVTLRVCVGLCCLHFNWPALFGQ